MSLGQLVVKLEFESLSFFSNLTTTLYWKAEKQVIKLPCKESEIEELGHKSMVPKHLIYHSQTGVFTVPHLTLLYSHITCSILLN